MENENTEKIFTIFKISFICCLWFFIALFLTFLFAITKVDAATIDINTYHIEGLNKTGQIVDNAFISNTLSVNSSTQVVGYEWYPMDTNWNYIGIEKSQYSIEIYFYITYNQNNFMDNALSNHNYLPSSYKMAVGNNLTATCDGTQSIDMYDKVIDNNTHIVTLNYKYTCSLLKVTQNFNKFAFNIYFDYFNFNSSQYFKTIVINRQLITDLNGISNDTNVIINNNNQNTQNIITNQNQNTQEINSNIDDLNSDIMNPNVDDQSSFFTSFDSGSTGNLTDIISLPLDFINSLSNSCQPIVFPTFSFHNFTFNLTLPCLSTMVYSHFDSSLINLLRLLINGIILYRMLIWFVDFIKGLKDPQNDDLEVMDL